MADTQISDAAALTPLFRSKKRKLYRQRAASPEAWTSGTPILDSPLSPTSIRSTPPIGPEERLNAYKENEPNMTDILRMRKLRKHRVGGVEFRVQTPTPAQLTSQELVAANAQVPEQEEGGLNAVKRFVSQTGTSVEGVDKHM